VSAISGSPVEERGGLAARMGALARGRVGELRPFILTMAAILTLDALAGLAIIGYGNTYLVNELRAPSSYPAYAIAVYGLVKLVTAPPGGWLLERLPGAAVVVAGAAAAIGGLLLITSVRNAEVYLIGVGLVSLGQALSWLNVFDVLGHRHRPEERATATAAMGLVSAAATATGLAVAALLEFTPHWRLPFFVAIGLAALTVGSLLPVQLRAGRRRNGGADSEADAPAAAEESTRGRRIGAALVVFAHFATITGLLAAMAPLVLDRLDLALLRAGFTLSPAAVGAVLGMVTVGLRSRPGSRLRTAALLYAGAAAAVTLMASAPSVAVVAIAAFPLGFCVGAAQPIVNAGLLDAAHAERRTGVALGYLFFVEGVGTVAGPALVGVVISLWDIRAGVATVAVLAAVVAVAAATSARTAKL